MSGAKIEGCKMLNKKPRQKWHYTPKKFMNSIHCNKFKYFFQMSYFETARAAQKCTELHRAAQSCTELHRVAQSCTELHRDAKRCKDLAEQFLYRYNLFYIMRWNGVKFFWDWIMIIIIAFIFLKWAFTE